MYNTSSGDVGASFGCDLAFRVAVVRILVLRFDRRCNLKV